MASRASRRGTHPPNILMLVVDTLRADHLSCYGYHRLTSPHLDRLAQQGVLFEQCIAPSVPTTPAYTTILTGMDVMATRMVALQPKEPLPDRLRTLPEVLRDRGYVSACVGFSGKDQEARYRGFDTYKNFRSWMSWAERPGDKAGKLSEVTLPLLEEYARADQPFFLFLRHMDPHAPYLPPAPFDHLFYSGKETDPAHLQGPSSMRPVFDFAPFAEFLQSWMPPGLTDGEYVIAQYDGAIAYMDACIQRLLTRLEELGLAENTIVVLSGDHGESLLEHEIYFDHHGLYEPTVHVPFVIRAPGRLPQGVRVAGTVAQQDFMPTLLDLLGETRLLRDLKMDGQSCLPLVRGERAANYSELYLTECTWMRKRGWRNGQWKLIEALEPDFHHKPPVELYDLVSDPQETRNLAEQEPEVVAHLRDRMQRWVDRRCRETGGSDPILEYQLGLNKRIGSIKEARDLQAKGETPAKAESADKAGAAARRKPGVETEAAVKARPPAEVRRRRPARAPVKSPSGSD